MDLKRAVRGLSQRTNRAVSSQTRKPSLVRFILASMILAAPCISESLRNILYDGCGGETFFKFNACYLSSCSKDRPGSDDLVRLPVGAFDQHIRPYQPDQPFGCILVEDGHEIDAFERGDDPRAV